METIAEINDLACRSIEMGDYHIALNVLNSCLGCVKQLKKVRARVLSESTSIAEIRRHKVTKECIVRTLRSAKRKLLDRSSVILEAKLAEGNKRKIFYSSLRSRKRRRPTNLVDQELYPNTVTVSSSEVSATSSDSTLPSSRYPFSATASATTINHESMTAPLLDNCSCNSSTHNAQTLCQLEHKEQQRFFRKDTEDMYFVYRKPIRLSKFQWDRIAESHCQEDQDGDSNHREEIQREVELAVSANLIFNIALSHHMIASSTKKLGRYHNCESIGLSPDSGEDTDDEDEEENGCGYGIVADSLETKQRLKGALRLYELGFRVHTKRVAFVMSFQGQPSRRGHLHSAASSIPSAPNSLPSVSLSLSSMESQLRPSPNNLRSRRRERNGDCNDELKSTTRFALALLNNCAHIHESLGQSEKAKVFQKRLLSFLLVIVDSGESVHDIIGDDPAVDGYLKNVFAGTVFDQNMAPAAMA